MNYDTILKCLHHLDDLKDKLDADTYNDFKELIDYADMVYINDVEDNATKYIMSYYHGREDAAKTAVEMISMMPDFGEDDITAFRDRILGDNGQNIEIDVDEL